MHPEAKLLFILLFCLHADSALKKDQTGGATGIREGQIEGGQTWGVGVKSMKRPLVEPPVDLCWMKSTEDLAGTA